MWCSMENEKKEKVKSLLRELLATIPVRKYPEFFTDLILELASERWQ